MFNIHVLQYQTEVHAHRAAIPAIHDKQAGANLQVVFLNCEMPNQLL